MNFYIDNNGFAYEQLNELAERYYSPPVRESAEAMQEGFKTIARCQLEMWALANRRARATLALPSKLAACRTPAAMMEAYFDFWRSGFMECADATHRVNEMLAPKATDPVPAAVKKPKVVPKVLRSTKPSFNGTVPESVDEMRPSP